MHNYNKWFIEIRGGFVDLMSLKFKHFSQTLTSNPYLNDGVFD